MTITRDHTHGNVRWATFDGNPEAGYPPGYENPDLAQLPVAIFDHLGELTDGALCATRDCEHRVGNEILDDENTVPSGQRWHDVTIFLVPGVPTPTAQCEECAFVTLTALTGKAPW